MSDKKTIFFFGKFLNPPLGGGEYFILKILKRLEKEGYNVAGGCYANPNNERFFTKNSYIDWEVIPVFRFSIGGQYDFEKVLSKTSPDLVITQSFDAP